MIDFRPSNKNTALIEIISLDSLYLRREKMNHDAEMPHRLGFSMLLFVQRQSGNHFVDFAKYPFDAGSLIFINKNQLNAFDLSNRPQGLAVLFTDELAARSKTIHRCERPEFGQISPRFSLNRTTIRLKSETNLPQIGSLSLGA